jgi:hypothetical protein
MSENNSFMWRGQPSEIGKTLMKTQTAPKSPAPPLTFTKKKTHPLRGSEAQKLGSKSRAPTANINTQKEES